MTDRKKPCAWCVANGNPQDCEWVLADCEDHPDNYRNPTEDRMDRDQDYDPRS